VLVKAPLAVALTKPVMVYVIEPAGRQADARLIDTATPVVKSRWRRPSARRSKFAGEIRRNRIGDLTPLALPGPNSDDNRVGQRLTGRDVADRRRDARTAGAVDL